MSKALGAVVGTGLLAGGGYLYATPYININQFREAIEARDVPAIERHVDFPAVRSSLKEQLKAKLSEEITKQAGDNLLLQFGLGSLGSAFGEPMINAAVDTYISPAGFKVLLAGTTPDAATPGSGDSTSAEASAAAGSTSAEAQVSAGYKSPNLFVVTSKDPQSGQSVKLNFERRDLVQWTLTSVSLP